MQKNQRLYKGFTYKGDPHQLIELISKQVINHDLSRFIPLIRIETYQYDNPFDVAIQPDINLVKDNSHIYQKFLYWLSSVGYGSWDLFKKTCNTLELDEPKRILRRLKLLGHIETSSDGQKWSIAPTAIVKVSSLDMLPEYILCGQQNSYLIEELKNFADIYRINQLNSPPCLRLKLINITNVQTLLDKIKNKINISINNSDNIAQNLALLLPDLENWKLNLKPLPGITESFYDWKYWQNGNFVECTLPQKTGMYQMWGGENKNAPRRTLFYDKNTKTWRQGDWYGLRFLALNYNQDDLIARYNPETLQLAIPYCQRWPELYERALVLSSGLLPKYKKTVEQNLWLIYENISLDLAHKLTQKLHVSCQEETV